VVYGRSFLNTLTNDFKNHHIFKLKLQLVSMAYLLLSMSVQITAADTGSFTNQSDISSSRIGVPIKQGSFKLCLAESRNCFTFTPHQTNIAHSGSIPSFQIALSSSLTK